MEIRRLRAQVHLYQTGLQLSSQQDIEILLSEAVAILRTELGSNVRSLAFLANREEITHLVNSGLPDSQARVLAKALLPQLQTADRGRLLEAVQHLVPDAAAAELRSLWLFPLRGDNGMQGALALINAAGRSFPTQFPQEALVFLAEQATLGFQNACRYLRAREMVYTDDLTELFNHRYLQVALEQELRRAERYGLQFTVAFIDIDQFKLVNDTYGHLVGSSTLRELGQILRNCVRNADLLFRYGGDEFTALLVETDNSGGKVVAERIRKAIAEYRFDAGQGQTHRITATVGYATYPVHATTRQELIDLSDRAMYKGKRVRNAICSAGEVASSRSATGEASGG
jgi:diguanylate cyclase (GGDEF)-like protein